MDLKLREELILFRQMRNWGDDHTGLELSRAIMVEAAELNRLFLWGDEPEPDSEELSDELADIAIYLEYLLDLYDIDINRAVREKIEKNARKYPK